MDALRTLSSLLLSFGLVALTAASAAHAQERSPVALAGLEDPARHFALERGTRTWSWSLAFLPLESGRALLELDGRRTVGDAHRNRVARPARGAD